MILSLHKPKNCYFLNQQRLFILKQTFLTFYSHITNAVKRRISSRYYHFNFITILSNSIAIKRVVMAASTFASLRVNSAKKSDTKCHSEQFPEQCRRTYPEPRRSNSEEFQWIAEEAI